ncbi:hypothetical protein ATY41_11355 [Leifsonia xyli subsp. xyli]|uniref:Uncharacterized protein n=1 Tax=Leifsonia xyli subsp. xyli TaxID=59736 RepID=A0A1E2SJW1_LEIXY|nr:hypothetical protein ATY41_11355 [Leifsonia xyli subsp. xyli]
MKWTTGDLGDGNARVRPERSPERRLASAVAQASARNGGTDDKHVDNPIVPARRDANRIENDPRKRHAAEVVE